MAPLRLSRIERHEGDAFYAHRKRDLGALFIFTALVVVALSLYLEPSAKLDVKA